MATRTRVTVALDPVLAMPPSEQHVRDPRAFVLDQHQWWADMVGEELPAGTLVNVYADQPANPGVYYLVIRYPGGEVQTDTYTLHP